MKRDKALEYDAANLALQGGSIQPVGALVVASLFQQSGQFQKRREKAWLILDQFSEMGERRRGIRLM